MQVELSNQVALVTGAARGIGRAIADALATNGARVLYGDVDRAEAEQAASAWPSAAAVAMDVTDETQIRAVVEAAARDGGRIDILVNNAGVNTLAHRVPIDQFPREEWDRILGVDLTGLYLVSKAVVPADAPATVRADRQYRLGRRTGPAAPAIARLWRPRRRSSISPRRWPSSWGRRESWSTRSLPARS